MSSLTHFQTICTAMQQLAAERNQSIRLTVTYNTDTNTYTAGLEQYGGKDLGWLDRPEYSAAHESSDDALSELAALLVPARPSLSATAICYGCERNLAEDDTVRIHIATGYLFCESCSDAETDVQNVALGAPRKLRKLPI